MAMVSLLFEARFSVQVHTQPGETVCITGNVPALGCWDPHKAVKLKRENGRNTLSASPSSLEKEEAVQAGNVWSKAIKFDTFEDIEYRYFVCRTFHSDNEDEEESIVIKQWETTIIPRVFSLQGKNIRREPQIDTFGKYDDHSSITRGWLTDQSQVNIDVHGNAMKMWQPRYKAGVYSIRCSAIDHYKDDEVEEEVDYHAQYQAPSNKNSVLVSILENGYAKPVEQDRYGVICKPDSYITFMVQTLEPETTGFHLDFYMHEESDNENMKDTTPRHIGQSHMLPVNIRKSKDTRTVPITSLKHKPLGQIQLDFLLIKPLIGHRFSMDVSYQMHWKRSRKALDIGHRGMGTSYSVKKLASVRENTVESLKGAASHGADYVELDVHLSKDHVPVIYHDFKIHVAYRKKRQGELELFEVSVKDLKLSELQEMKLFHSAAPEHKGAFTNINAAWPGSAHDSHVFRTSRLAEFLQTEQRTLEDGIILGDSGYACLPYLLTPYRNPDSPAKQRYQDRHTSTRVTIERTFGRWKRRFHVLHAEIKMVPSKACRIAIACAVLHNIAILLKEPEVEDGEEGREEQMPQTPPFVGRETGQGIREHITNAFFRN